MIQDERRDFVINMLGLSSLLPSSILLSTLLISLIFLFVSFRFSFFLVLIVNDMIE
jgi:hypothetical protein